MFLNDNNKTSHKVNLLKINIIKVVNELNILLNSNYFLIYSNENYILKPGALLKFWDILFEENDVNNYSDLNKLFLVKTLIKTGDTIKAFNEIKIVLTNENIFDKSCIFLYYFGKILTYFVDRYDTINELEIKKLLNGDIENYSKIKKIMLEYGHPNSINFKKKGKNYMNLAKISEFFKVDPKK